MFGYTSSSYLAVYRSNTANFINCYIGGEFADVSRVLIYSGSLTSAHYNLEL